MKKILNSIRKGIVITVLIMCIVTLTTIEFDNLTIDLIIKSISLTYCCLVAKANNWFEF